MPCFCAIALNSLNLGDNSLDLGTSIFKLPVSVVFFISGSLATILEPTGYLFFNSKQYFEG